MKRAVGYCDDVEFSPEDAARTERDFLCQVVEAAIEAGATTVNIPDTVGYATPQEYRRDHRTLKNRVPNIDKAVISTHCHNDLGLAVANSLAAVENGAGQIECTINGIGERAGNCSLEEVVMAMKTRADHYHCTTGINTHAAGADQPAASRRSPACTCSATRRSSAATRSPTKPAFIRTACSRSGGPTKSCSPKTSAFSATDLVLGKHSGRAALADRGQGLGYTLTGEQLQKVFDEFKKLADKKKEIYDGDIIALIEAADPRRAGRGRMEARRVRSHQRQRPQARERN